MKQIHRSEKCESTDESNCAQELQRSKRITVTCLPVREWRVGRAKTVTDTHEYLTLNGERW